MGPLWQRYRLWRMNDACASEQNDVLAEILRTVHRQEDADAQVRALRLLTYQKRSQLTGRGSPGVLPVNAARIRVRAGSPVQTCADFICASNRVPGGPDRPRTRPQRGVVRAVAVVYTVLRCKVAVQCSSVVANPNSWSMYRQQPAWSPRRRPQLLGLVRPIGAGPPPPSAAATAAERCAASPAWTWPSWQLS